MAADSLVMTVAEFAAAFHLSKASVYRSMDSGEVPEIHLGGRRLIPRAHAQRLIDQAMAETEAS